MRIYQQLERIRRFDLNERQRVLVQAQKAEDTVRARLNALDDEMGAQINLIEQDSSLMRYFEAYHQQYKERRAILEADLKAARQAVTAAENDVRMAYAEKKKIEIIGERRRIDQQLHLTTVEQQQSDEQFLARILRHEPARTS